MKKIILLLVVVLTVTLVSCDSGNDSTLEDAYRSLEISEEVSTGYQLPSSIGDVSITWSSGKDDIIDESNLIIGSYEEITTTLSASLTYQNRSMLRVFNITVLIDPTVERPIVEPPVNQDNVLDIYYLNDLHGAITSSDDQIGLSNISNYLDMQNRDNTVFVAGGDMLQGSALSNYYYGLSTINILNEMGLDAMALGNHEFDWGLDTVTAYFDGDETNGEASFPLLSVNTFFEGTDTVPDGIEPYVIVERSGINVGIIGSIGSTLENSIATSKIAGYEFVDPVEYIEEYAIHLRTVEDCDVVILISHDSGGINDAVAALEGDANVDAIFNAHSHSTYAETYLGLPVMQSGDNGEFLGHVQFEINEGQITSYSAENLSYYSSTHFSSSDDSVDVILNGYLEETDPIFNTNIITSGDSISRSELSYWISEVMCKATDSDIAFHNFGGTRTDVDANEDINIALLYQIWPFDNVLKTVELEGSVIRSFMSDGIAYYTDITNFEDGVYYKVVTNDYVFDKTYNPFINGLNPQYTGIYLRDIAQIELGLQQNNYTFFYTYNEILITPSDVGNNEEDE